MDITKLSAIAIIGMLISSLLKERSPLFSRLLTIGCSIVIISHIIPELSNIFSSFQNILEYSGISRENFKNIIKVIGVAYFTEITSWLLKDAGENAIAAKIDIAGRIFILSLTIPAIKQLLDVIISALSLI